MLRDETLTVSRVFILQRFCRFQTTLLSTMKIFFLPIVASLLALLPGMSIARGDNDSSDSMPTNKVSTIAVSIPTVEQIAHSLQVLAKAGVNLDNIANVDWGRRKTSEEDSPQHMFETSIVIHVEGVDPDDLTTQEEAFVQDALEFSFHQVSPGSDYTILSSHFATKGQDSGGPEEEVLAVDTEDDYDTVDGMLRKRRRRKSSSSGGGSSNNRRRRKSNSRRRGWYGYYGGFGCRLCGGKRSAGLKNSHDGLSTSLAQVFATEESELVEQWEDAFMDILVESRYDVFADLEDVTFDLSQPLVALSSSSLTTSTEKVQAAE